MTTGFVLTSDVHLRPDSPELLQDWVSCVDAGLRRLTTSQKRIVVLGDLWDLYIHGNPYYAKQAEPVQQQIRRWQATGATFEWFEGNHDLFLPQADHTLESGELKFHVCHGDTLNPLDKNYLRLKRALHFPATRILLQNLPGSWLERLGRRMSHASRTEWSQAKPWGWEQYEEALKQRVPQWEAQGVSLVVFGHCHWKKDVLLGQLRVVNLGFFPRDRQVFVISPSETAWVGHSEESAARL